MAEASKKEGLIAKIKRGFREMRSELKKVVWPTKSQIVNNVIIVLVCCLIVGACIWIFDGLAGAIVRALLALAGKA